MLGFLLVLFGFFFQLEQGILLYILQNFIQTNNAFIAMVYIGLHLLKLLSLRSE